MSQATFDEIASALSQAKTILVASHIRPDGDALGSTLAAALWLRALGKNVSAWNEDGMLDKFHYLPAHELVTKPPVEKQKFDVVFALDTSVRNRLGTVLNAVENASIWINMDHHISNEKFADMNYVDPSAPAMGQILFEFFQHVGAKITLEIATNLFAAISTDTGSFQYAGTNARTFRIAAELVKSGVDVASLSRCMYESQPRRRLNLLRYALNAAKFTCEDRLASFALSLQDVVELGIVPEDNEGIIDHLRSVDGVVAAVFFEELPEGKVRVSARSKDPRIDVCKICQLFKGGGHPLAAGARVSGALGEVEENFLKVVCDEIRKRN